ncbi:modification methylase HemK [Nitrobacter sp. Nb-311A]|uniref:peptide chain release factor N(5)-glutamine methyltransferase n=1 Tax=unclassified Nitrobacter TaxID=2620411 RepID=UPI0000686483|nr:MULTISPECIES: peptide chain release factor N(5)-glutamine methyltransferase [unclassified Nitrobacter]EAQ37584.1 modification methylase HemK [Nitrobacter sp. Nb-311A]MCB1392562.1 peptide chain release factor N(5)-glutamine methyltransferase [Nitrobacter sp.]MCV0386433.1 peptide chain release factor N(5)-glutamine methyltransferase [Nitrobacter sp.]
MADSFAAQTIETIRRALTARFEAAGIDSAALEARMLTGAVLGLDLTGLVAQGLRQLDEDDAARLDAFARRRLAGEPLARILGTKEFWGLPLKLSSDTLVPRADTETVVETALDILRAEGRMQAALRIADLGTGSGAILLALLTELPAATGVGTDLSAAALDTAKTNAQDVGLATRAQFLVSDYGNGLSGPFDLIVSNPPYIRSADIATLAPEVRDHDPPLALDGGRDGLDAYRRIAPQALSLLADGGLLVLEIGQGQDSAVSRLMAAAGLTVMGSARTDLAGIGRAVVARRVALIKPD